MSNENCFLLKSGDAFPVPEIMFDVQCLITVKTVTDVEMIIIKKRQFINCFKTYGMNYYLENLSAETLEQLLTQDYEVRSTSSTQTNIMHKPIEKKSIISRLSKTIKFRKTINPNNRRYKQWELFKCFLLILQLNIIYFSFNLLFPYSNTIIIIELILDLFGFADIIIRSHLQYYNQNGLLITDSRFTLRNYVTSSMIIDIVGAFPFRLLGLDRLGVPKDRFYLGCHYHVLFRRILQVYRIHGGLMYLKSIRSKWSGYFDVILIVLYYWLIDLLFVAFFTSRLCDIDEKTFKISCTKSPHFLAYFTYDQSTAAKPITISHITSLLGFIPTSIFAGQSTLSQCIFNDEHLLLLTFFIIVIILFWVYVSSKLVVLMVSHTYESLPDCGVVRTLDTFAANEYIDLDVIKNVIKDKDFQRKHLQKDIYEGTINFKAHTFRNNRLGEVNQQRSIMIPNHEKYWDTLMNVQLFDGDPNCCRYLLSHIQIMHVMEDVVVMENNDVQKWFYIVHRGEVIVQICNDNFANLGHGGTFGSIDRKGYTRQTIKVTTYRTTELIMLPTTVLGMLGTIFPRVDKKLKLARMEHRQFEQENKFTYTPKEEGKPRPYPRLQAFFYLHFIPISLCLTMKMIPFLVYNFLGTYFVLLFYWLDCIFLLHMLLMVFHQKEFLKILIIISLISILPIELVLQFYFNKHLIQLAIWNRLLRVVHFMVYYYRRIKKLAYYKLLTVWFIFYLSWFYICFISMTWVAVICDGTRCPYYDRVKEKTIQFTNSWLEVEVTSLYFAVNVLIRGNLNTIGPIGCSPSDLYFYFMVYQTGALITIGLYAIFTNLIYLNYFSKIRYFCRVDDLVRNLKKRDVSEVLLHETKKYFEAMWNRHLGEYPPNIVTEASPYLQEHILAECYAEHIGEHVLFAETHDDFLRQLYTHVQRKFFIPTQIITEQGDVDKCIYFIIIGFVQAIEVKDDENYEFVLKPNQSFGELSGLFGDCQRATFTCLTCVDLLVLQMDQWIYLLDWFPAAKEHIFYMAEQYRRVASLHIQ